MYGKSRSKLYSKIYSENPHGFKKVVSGFTNFIKYLKDDNVVINHTYLCDIVCSRNADLFPKGLNLIIMENKNADITNNVHEKNDARLKVRRSGNNNDPIKFK